MTTDDIKDRVHFLVRFGGYEGAACGHPYKHASTVPDHVTCHACQGTVAYQRAAKKRRAAPPQRTPRP